MKVVSRKSLDCLSCLKQNGIGFCLILEQVTSRDDFRHELVLYVDGLLFTGCAHSGLENILAACPWPVYTVVGGFHLLDGQETEEEIKALPQRLKTNYPQTQFYTSHCTGDNVFEVMRDVMGKQLQSFRCGTMIE